MNAKRIISLCLTAVMGLLLLSGCGPKEPSNSSTNAPNVNTEHREDLVVCMPEDLETFDPVATSSMSSQTVLKMVYVRLYGEDEQCQPVDWLAKEFNVISDNEIQIKIHEGAKFSDGSEIKAEDVVYCLNRALQSPNFGTLMSTVETFEVIDDYTIRICTKGPSPSIKLALMHPGTGILPKAYVEKAVKSGDWTNPVCSGPYKLDKRAVGDNVRVVKNENFFDPASGAQNNSLTFKYVPEASSRTIMVETGEADVNFAFSTADYNRAKEDPNLKVHENVGTIVQYIGVDTTLPPFDNATVRQALCYAINRDDVMTVVVEGLGTPAYSVLPPSTLGYLENPGKYTYDPEKAKALLAEAGYADGFNTTLVAFNDLGKRVAEIVQMSLDQVGIHAKIETYDSSVRMTMLANHQVPMFAGQWGAMPDADLVLPRLFTKEAIGGMNFTHYTNPKLDELFVKARSTYDTEERIGYYNECVELLAEEAPWCPLYIASAFSLTRADLQGVELSGESIINLQKLHY